MNNVNTLIDKFKDIAHNPDKLLEKYLKDGKKVVGCFPVYTPQPLVTAAGLIPMGLWGGQINPTVAGKYNPIFTCSVMRSCLEYGMTGVYGGLSAVMMPMLCDTFRGMSAVWRVAVPAIPIISFIHTQNRADAGALNFMVDEYKSVKLRLEEISGKEITEKALTEAIELYNKRNHVVREFCEVANDHLDIITATVRHNVMKSINFIETTEAIELIEELIQALKNEPIHKWTGKRVILSGLTAEPDGLLDIFAENNIAVVGDDLAQESRQYRTDYPFARSAMERLGAQWLNVKGCSMAHEDDYSVRGQMLVDMAKEKDADCIAV